MIESSVYQSVMADGFKRGIRASIIRVAEVRLGPIDESTRQMLESTHDVEQLESLLKRALSANNWNELLNDSSSD